ncbi:hemagglutinin repeat-containing protein, partial [Achromobacter marplatensis]|uniref:hemagglutinin repeat-containing protein n=1 Tax=Achromobacter marplatensis TaxID=470868 RepID=UPI0039F6C143
APASGRDIDLATLEESHGESLVRNKKNRHDLSTSQEIGTNIAAGGNVTLIAGQDVNARAADVTAGEQLAVGASRDINLTAGVQCGSTYVESHYKTKGSCRRRPRIPRRPLTGNSRWLPPSLATRPC